MKATLEITVSLLRLKKQMVQSLNENLNRYLGIHLVFQNSTQFTLAHLHMRQVDFTFDAEEEGDYNDKALFSSFPTAFKSMEK